MPSRNSTNELADRFQTYFKEEISSIREAIPITVQTCLTSFKGNTILDKFESATEDEIREIIGTYGINCSPEDPIPVSLIKNNLDTFIPI